METNPTYSIQIIVGLTAIAMFVGGVVVAMGKAKFVTKKDCDKKCEGSDALETKEDCEKKHNSLTTTLCGKIDVVQRDVDAIMTDMDKVEKSIAKFTFFMGQVSQYMTDVKDGKHG